MKRIVTVLFTEQLLHPEAHFGRVEDFQLEGSDFFLKNNKTSGEDMIPGVTLKKVFNVDPHLLLRIYNACLSGGCFPLVGKPPCL